MSISFIKNPNIQGKLSTVGPVGMGNFKNAKELANRDSYLRINPMQKEISEYFLRIMLSNVEMVAQYATRPFIFA